MNSFVLFGLSAFVMVGVVLAGVVYYLKKRGVLRAAANAATAAATTAVAQDVQSAADKLTK